LIGSELVAKELLEEVLDAGFIQFSSDPECSTLDVARSFGEVEVIPDIPAIQTLTPARAGGEEKSSYSGNFGLGAFPLHTDMAHWVRPPRFLLLRCAVPAAAVKTRFLCARKLFAEEDAHFVRRALFRPRRRLDGRLSLVRLEDRGMYRWDTLFLQAANQAAAELQLRVADRIRESTPASIELVEPGDCVLANNWGALHGRSSVPRSALSRVIERIYISRIGGT
jgi:L-asparagine oxygenase